MMKALKRGVCIALAVCMAALLGVGAMAAQAGVSTQKIKVDGQAVSARPYIINDYNYFKLRDVAAMLSGTASQFEVSYNSQKREMYIYTGRAYTPVGGELSAEGAGDAAAYEKSTWSLFVDGHPVSCQVYTISGSNYFKLRDVASAAGFALEYDEAARTVLISTAKDAAWTPDISFTTKDAAGTEWTDACFKDHELTMVNYWAYWCGPCVNEMPDLQKLSEKYADKGVQVIGVYDGFDQAYCLPVMETAGVKYPCLHYAEAFDAYMATGYLPTTIFVDGSGKVVGEAYVGARSYNDWAAVIDGLLK